jgi:hypothetical protein
MALSQWIQAKGLCLSIANNTNYIGCDCETCHFACVKGIIVWCVIVGGP